MLTVDQVAALRKTLDELGTIPRAVQTPGRKTAYRGRYDIAKKYGLKRPALTQIVTGSCTVGLANQIKIIRAVAHEAAEAGVEFPVELFVEYLSHEETSVEGMGKVHPSTSGRGAGGEGLLSA